MLVRLSQIMDQQAVFNVKQVLRNLLLGRLHVFYVQLELIVTKKVLLLALHVPMMKRLIKKAHKNAKKESYIIQVPKK
jgi:hypothetical protein